MNSPRLAQRSLGARNDSDSAMTLPFLPNPHSPQYIEQAENSLSHPTDSLSPKPPSHPPIRHPSSDESIDYDTSRFSSPKSSSVTVRQSSVQGQTTFHFAHPVTSPNRLKMTSRLVLQLRESDQMSRSIPKYDIFTAAVARRLISRIRKVPGSCRGLGPRDLVIVRNDMCEKHHFGGNGRRGLSERLFSEHNEVVATLFQQPKDAQVGSQFGSNVEIVSSRGQSWEGTLLSNGSYEFVYKDDRQQQRKLRWVAREKASSQASGTSTVGKNHIDGPRRFILSSIDPKLRRHPVIASMTPIGINVLHKDSHPLVRSTSERAPFPTPDTTRPHGPVSMENELHLLIVASAIWVTFMEGWAVYSPGGDMIKLK